MQDVFAEAMCGLDQVVAVTSMVSLYPKPSVDIGGETGFHLGHGVWTFLYKDGGHLLSGTSRAVLN